MYFFSINILSKIHSHFNWILKTEKGLDKQKKCESIADGERNKQSVLKTPGLV